MWVTPLPFKKLNKVKIAITKNKNELPIALTASPKETATPLME